MPRTSMRSTQNSLQRGMVGALWQGMKWPEGEARNDVRSCCRHKGKNSNPRPVDQSRYSLSNVWHGVWTAITRGMWYGLLQLQHIIDPQLRVLHVAKVRIKQQERVSQIHTWEGDEFIAVFHV